MDRENFRKRIRRLAETNAVYIEKEKRHIGIIFTLFGWFLLAINSVMNIEIIRSTNIFMSFFFQFLGAFAFYFFLGLGSCSVKGVKETIKYLKPNEPLLVLARGSLGVVAFYLFSASKIWTSVVENSVLFSTEAFYIPLILRWFLKQKIRRLVWVGISLGFIGVSLTYFSDISVLNIGGLIGFFAGILMAFIILLTSYMVKKDPPTRIATYQMGIGTIVSALPALLNWQMLSSDVIFLMLFSGVIYAIALFLFLEAFYYTESYIIGTLSYALIIFTEIVDWMLQGVDNKHLVLSGIFFIIIGGLIVVLSSYRKEKPPKPLTSARSAD